MRGETHLSIELSRLMKTNTLTLIGITVALAIQPGRVAVAQDSGSADGENAQTVFQPPASVEEARARAQLLHQTIHDTLHIVHRDFFDADDSIAIPSHSFEDVFAALTRSYGIQLRWLAADAKAMNIDNKPQTDFEKQAVKAVSSGQKYVEEISDETFVLVGRIHLPAQCLKCHLPQRSSNSARSAGLMITIPMRERSE